MNPLPSGPFDVVYADPPWDYDHPLSGGPHDIGMVDPAEHYDVMKDGEIADMPVRDIVADDALLFLWTTSPKLEVGMKVGRGWGFTYCTVGFVWDKQRMLPAWYTIPQTEMCLLFRRGRIPKPRGARNVKQFLSHPRTAHSRKPDAFRRGIDLMFPTQRKIELFARAPARGWTTWGNETDKFEQAPERLFA